MHPQGGTLIYIFTQESIFNSSCIYLLERKICCFVRLTAPATICHLNDFVPIVSSYHIFLLHFSLTPGGRNWLIDTAVSCS